MTHTVALTAPLGGCSRMITILGHKGAGCVPSVVHGRRRGLSGMNGILSGQRHAGAVWLHATAISCDKHLFHRCPASQFSKQSQERLWKRTSRLTRHTVRVSAMAAMPQLLPVTSTFGIWAALNLAAALGLWSEKTRHAQ